jgi:hypothetical protein
MARLEQAVQSKAGPKPTKRAVTMTAARKIMKGVSCMTGQAEQKARAIPAAAKAAQYRTHRFLSQTTRLALSPGMRRTTFMEHERCGANPHPREMQSQ